MAHGLLYVYAAPRMFHGAWAIVRVRCIDNGQLKGDIIIMHSRGPGVLANIGVLCVVYVHQLCAWKHTCDGFILHDLQK